MFGWQVCTQPGWTAQGTQGQKRLILDHASEMYAHLRSGAGKKLVLEAGYGPEEGEEGDITLCKVSRTAQSAPPSDTDRIGDGGAMPLAPPGHMSSPSGVWCSRVWCNCVVDGGVRFFLSQPTFSRTGLHRSQLSSEPSALCVVLSHPKNLSVASIDNLIKQYRGAAPKPVKSSEGDIDVVFLLVVTGASHTTHVDTIRFMGIQ